MSGKALVALATSLATNSKMLNLNFERNVGRSAESIAVNFLQDLWPGPLAAGFLLQTGGECLAAHIFQASLMNAGQPSNESVNQTLARIDREIEQLLREGKLSPLNYSLPFDQFAKINRRKNLKSLLTARRYYRQMKLDAD